MSNEKVDSFWMSMDSVRKQTSHPCVKLFKSVQRPLCQGCNEGSTDLLVLSRCVDGS